MKIYKIRGKSSGLFSSGGSLPTFSKSGKTWSELNHIKAHISLVRNTYKSLKNYWKKHNVITVFPYHDCEIVEFEIVELNKEDINE